MPGVPADQRDRHGAAGEPGMKDAEHLRAVCSQYLHLTRWARELGDPIPKGHRGHSASEESLREIRHRRRVCRLVVGEESLT